MKPIYCRRCGYKGQPKTKVKGYFVLEVLLWILFILPGLCYTIYRLANKIPVCPKCKGEDVIPLDSPILKA